MAKYKIEVTRVYAPVSVVLDIEADSLLAARMSARRQGYIEDDYFDAPQYEIAIADVMVPGGAKEQRTANAAETYANAHGEGGKMPVIDRDKLIEVLKNLKTDGSAITIPLADIVKTPPPEPKKK